MAKIAIFPGSFDPFTKGHLATVARSADLFDEVIVTVMTNTSKQALFTPAERVALIADATADLPNVSVQAHAGALTVDIARELHAGFIVRGLRNASDYTFENEIALANAKLAPEIVTVLLPTRAPEQGIASSIVKEVATFGGDVTNFVTPNVAAALRQKMEAANDQTQTD
jgi:pantetheine-phosphate adenylyltransferase